MFIKQESLKYTLAICCYRFERFIIEAVESAFAQTYRPLEIVISDDHSPDASWERIVESVIRLGRLSPSGSEPWRTPDFCGKIEFDLPNDVHLVLNRNEHNLGVGSHISKLFEISRGEWIVLQAGDDVSMPNRMEVIAKRVEEVPEIRCLHSRLHVIDSNGYPFKIPESFKNTSRGRGSGLPSVIGAGAAYHRDVYWKFGPLGAKVGNEDHVLPLRASLLGTVELIQDRLVRYRKHGNNASGCFSSDAMDAARCRLRLIHSYYQGLDDLHTAEEIGLTATRKAIGRYRKLITCDMEIQWVLGHWTLHSQMRGQIIWHLVTSPQLWVLFASRLLHRILL